MKHQEIKFKHKSYQYSIFIGEKTINLLPKKINSLCPKTKKIAIIIDIVDKIIVIKAGR